MKLVKSDRYTNKNIKIFNIKTDIKHVVLKKTHQNTIPPDYNPSKIYPLLCPELYRLQRLNVSFVKGLASDTDISFQI